MGILAIYGTKQLFCGWDDSPGNVTLGNAFLNPYMLKVLSHFLGLTKPRFGDFTK
jgi:hypothetical protein